jgi:hypothetical protein
MELAALEPATLLGAIAPPRHPLELATYAVVVRRTACARGSSMSGSWAP